MRTQLRLRKRNAAASAKYINFYLRNHQKNPARMDHAFLRPPVAVRNRMQLEMKLKQDENLIISPFNDQ